MKISEIMTKDVYTIRPDATLKQCAEAMKRHDVNNLVVMDGQTVAGVITKTDIFKSILPSYADIIEDERHLESFEYIEGRVHKLYDLTVRDLMSAPAITISGDMPIVRAGSLMILRRIKQLPVADNGRLMGIITFTNIINHFLEKVK